MANFENVTCPRCKKRVEAEIIDSTLTKHTYLCPNPDSNGRDHTFTKTKKAVKAAKVVMSVVTIVTGGGFFGGGN